MKNAAPRRLTHFTPLRYPGGKAKLAPLIKTILEDNSLIDGTYVEPFAGGAGIALELLLQGYVSEIYINDISLPIYAFWNTVLNDGAYLQDKIVSAHLTVEEWDRQKAIFKDADPSDLRALGFATFFLNRTNRSGVLNAGVIGGRAQEGQWLIGARYNATELAYRVKRISDLACQIHLSCRDAMEFLAGLRSTLARKSLIYADPPYFEKGRQLYYDYYVSRDHKLLADFMSRSLSKRNWVVSYDDVPAVREFYSSFDRASYSIPYSVRAATMGEEVMFFSPRLIVPQALGDRSLSPQDSPRGDLWRDTLGL